VLGAVLVATACGWRFHVRAGGITGDFLGATQQLVDAAILVALAAG
jgi:adenosylcobinamide-GDP ribazoletransferase